LEFFPDSQPLWIVRRGDQRQGKERYGQPNGQEKKRGHHQDAQEQEHGAQQPSTLESQRSHD
jgi:hypothetical protein